MAEVETGAAEQPAASIRDSLSAAFDEQEKAAVETPEIPEAKDPPATAEPTTAASPEARARDAQGRFIKADGTVDTAAPEAAPAPAAATPDPKAPATLPGEAPQHWSAEDKALVAKLPPEIRAEYIDRFKKMEAGFAPKLQRAAELEKSWGEVDKFFEPHNAAMQAQGWNKTALVKAWADVEVGLARDPYAQMRTIAQHYKVDLRKLAGFETPAAGAQAQQPPAPQQPGGEAQAPSPEMKALQDEIAALKSTVGGFTEAQQRAIEQAQRVATERTLTEIQAFAEAKAEDGTPSHPHFNDVMADMLAHAAAAKAAGRTPDLKTLYDQAVWANPTTRAKQLAATEAATLARQEAQRKQAAAEQKAKADAAKRAGASVTGAPSGTGQAPSHASKGSIRADIEAAIDDAA